MPGDDVKVSRNNLGIQICKVLLVVLPLLGLGGYAASNRAESQKSHAQSEKGYSLLATMVNQHEQRLDVIERQRVASSQPAISLGGPIIIPGGRVDPYGLSKSMSKAPPKRDGAVVLVNPKYRQAAPAPARTPEKALQRAPSKLKDVP